MKTSLSVEDRRALYSAMLAARDVAQAMHAESPLRARAEHCALQLAHVLDVKRSEIEGVFTLWPGERFDFYAGTERHECEVLDVLRLDDERAVCRLMVDHERQLWRLYEQLPAETAAARRADRAMAVRERRRAA